MTGLGAVAVAVSQEDTDLAGHAKMLAKIPGKPRFELVADLNGAATRAFYHPTTTYVIDAGGTVRQVMPMTVRHRAAWAAIFGELAGAGSASTP